MTSIQRVDRGRDITGAERCDAEGKKWTNRKQLRYQKFLSVLGTDEEL